MNTTTLERKLKTSQTNYKRYETLIQNLTEQRHQVRAPYAKQIETLQTKMEVVSEGIRKRLRQAEIKHGQKEAEVRTLTRNIIMKRYQDVVPSVDEFLVLARYTEFFLEPGDDSTECGLMEIKRYQSKIS